MKTELLKLDMQYFAEPTDPTEPQTDPIPPTEPPIEPPLADPKADPASVTDPVTEQPKVDGTVYTPAQLEELKASWAEEQAQAAADAKDFEKMNPEQKAQKQLVDAQAEQARLKEELADRDLTDYARGALTKAELPAEALAFIKGIDQVDTDARIKSFGELLAAGVQSGVEGRFKQNGYTPRGTAVGVTDTKNNKKTRGVSIE